MTQTREFVIIPKEGDSIRPEFDRFLEAARERGWDQFNVLFGFAWGNYVYEHNWIAKVISLDDLKSKVTALEHKNDGSIGDDDLFVTVEKTGVQHTFCHENDIHLEGRPDDEYLTAEVARYRHLGWEVHERTNSSEQGGGAKAD